MNTKKLRNKLQIGECTRFMFAIDKRTIRRNCRDESTEKILSHIWVLFNNFREDMNN